jgi:DNA polymerase III sliding clamp (beta) subunit (PCNA family)
MRSAVLYAIEFNKRRSVMKFTISSDKIQKLVSIAGTVNEQHKRRALAGMHTHITFDTLLDGVLRVIGHGLDKTIIITSNDSITEFIPGQVTVSANNLQRALRAFGGSTTLVLETKTTASLHVHTNSNVNEQWLPLERPVPEPRIDTQTPFRAITLSRFHFLEAARVAIAVNQKGSRPDLLYWQLRVDRNGYRSTGGDGDSFIVREQFNLQQHASEAPESILIRRDQTSMIVASLELSDADNVTLQEQEEPAGRTVISCGSTLIVLDGGPKPKWPDENKLLCRTPSYRFSVRTDELADAVKGIAATRDIEGHETHFARIRHDGEHLVLSVDSEVGCTRSVPLAQTFQKPEIGLLPPCECSSIFLGKILRHATPGGLMHLEFEVGSRAVVIRYSVAEMPGAFKEHDLLPSEGTWVTMFGLRKPLPGRDTVMALNTPDRSRTIIETCEQL